MSVNQRLANLDDLDSAYRALSGGRRTMSLVDITRELYVILEPHAALIGGICGFMHGVERLTPNIDMVTDLMPNQVLETLQKSGLSADIVRGDALDPLPWVVRGEHDGVPFQILPAGAVGVDLNIAIVQADMRFASVQDFIVSKCIAAGMADMRDVAVLIMKRPELLSFAEEQAEGHRCKSKLDEWVNDQRLREKWCSPQQ